MKIKYKKSKAKKQTKKLKRKQKGGNNDSFGFIFTRCVRNKEDNQIWINCYKSIRKFYKEKILIITDGSNKELIEDIPLENVELIDSEFNGAAEILPHYYFYKLRPFKKAVLMQDSMWFMKGFDFKNYDLKDVAFLWHFSSGNIDFPDTERELAELLGKEVTEKYNSKDWIGSFGGCSFITLDFIDKLQNKFNYLQLVNILPKERKYRHSFERIFGVICCLLSENIKIKPSIFGYYTDLKIIRELKNVNSYKNTNASVNELNMLKITRNR